MKIYDRVYKQEDVDLLKTGDVLKYGDRVYPFLRVEGDNIVLLQLNGADKTEFTRNRSDFLYDHIIQFHGRLHEGDVRNLVGHIIETVDTCRFVAGPYFVESMEDGILYCMDRGGSVLALYASDYWNEGHCHHIVDHGVAKIPEIARPGAWFWMPDCQVGAFITHVTGFQAHLTEVGRPGRTPRRVEYNFSELEGFVPIPSSIPAESMARYVTLKAKHFHEGNLTNKEVSWMTTMEGVLSKAPKHPVQNLDPDERHKEAIIAQMTGRNVLPLGIRTGRLVG